MPPPSSGTNTHTTTVSCPVIFHGTSEATNAPSDIRSPHALQAYRRYWPRTKFIIGLRHPVKWFENPIIILSCATITRSNQRTVRMLLLLLRLRRRPPPIRKDGRLETDSPKEWTRPKPMYEESFIPRCNFIGRWQDWEKPPWDDTTTTTATKQS